MSKSVFLVLLILLASAVARFASAEEKAGTRLSSLLFKIRGETYVVAIGQMSSELPCPPLETGEDSCRAGANERAEAEAQAACLDGGYADAVAVPGSARPMGQPTGSEIVFTTTYLARCQPRASK